MDKIMRETYKDVGFKKCKRCKGELPITWFSNPRYCDTCVEIIKVGKISKEDLVKEVIELRDKVQGFIESEAGIDL